jgi:hypothetical protein|tara:strand:- start:236 stop:886 length:651 start_codon:yes stop_codon:yes gene_type:complete
MSFTYDQLKTAIQDYTENTESSFVTNLPVFIRLTEERILKQVQLSLFRKNSTAFATLGNEYLAAPSDFLAPFSMSFLNASSEKVFLEFKDVNFIQTYNANSATTGDPKYYAQFDVDNFILGPAPSAASQMELHFFYRPVSLTAGAGGGTTWLSTEAQLCLLYGCLVEAYTFMKGEPDLQQLYSVRFQEALTALKMLGEADQTQDEYTTGQVVRPRQ